MKRLLLGIFLVAAGLAAACGDNGSNDQNASPTVEPGSPSPATTMSAEEIITLTQEFPVLYKVDNPDGTFELKPSTINSRMDVLCADEPKWSARQSDDTWQVMAECKKEESGTLPPFGYQLLRFEWLFYPDSREVWPISQAAHDAQYPFPQPSPFPLVTPALSPSPSGTQ